MVTSPDDNETPSLANHIPPQPCPRTTGIGSVVDQQHQLQQQALAAQRMDAVMGLENFRFCSVLGRGHFGKVRPPFNTNKSLKELLNPDFVLIINLLIETTCLLLVS
jgi:hypothetical protein